MQSIGVRCQSCGAPLQVSSSIRFVTCGFCHSELEVVRDQDTIHTEVLERIDERTSRMQESLKVIELQNDIARLDRDWERWCERNLDQSPSGGFIFPPAPAPPVTWWNALKVGGGVGALGGVIVLASGGPLYLYPLIIGIGTVLMWLSGQSPPTAFHYHRQLAKYELARQSLNARLLEARNQAGQT